MGGDAAQRWVLGEAFDGKRLDSAIAELAGVSRAAAQRWIEAGNVLVEGRAGVASQRVRSGAELRVEPPEPIPTDLVAEAIPLSVLYEDEDLIVVDKPAGLVVHPAPGHTSGTLVHALLHHCRDLAGIGGALRPGIVHRLDRGTSGVLVVAKRDDAHLALAAQFQDHRIEREYRALVRGRPGAQTGRIERAIGRHPSDRKRMSVATRRGRAAATVWFVERRFPASDRTWLRLVPETGRTHQLRVHLASIGLPIVGDPVYGGGARRAARDIPTIERPALHALRLGFRHPRSGEWLRFEAPLPEDLTAVLAALEALEAREPAARATGPRQA